MIGPLGEPIARNGLYRRGTKSVATSPGSPGGPARLLLSVSRSHRSSLPAVRPRSRTHLSQLLPSHPSILRRVRVTHTRIDSSFAGTIRVVSVRAEACKQVRWMHSVHSTGFSSSSSITHRLFCSTSCARVLPSLLFLSFSLLPSRTFSPRSPCMSRRVSSSLFHSRFFLLFRSALQSGFFHEDLRFPLRRIIAGNRSP